MKRTHTLAALAALLAAAPLAAQPGDAARTETAKRYVQWFYEGKVDTLWTLLTPRMQQVAGGKEGFTAFQSRFVASAGAEAAVLRESSRDADGLTTYERVARFSRAPVVFQVRRAVDADGKIAGFGIRPSRDDNPAPQPAASRYRDYVTKTPLRLPFQGEWYVFWGGRTLEQNYHAAVADQRFAYDFMARRQGRSHSGDGTKVQDYYCWGRPVLAPGAGTVVEAVDGLPDNAPGTTDPQHPAGNHVIIDHANGEYSLLAHLKRGSVAVRQGARVEAGAQLGACGNSGNTSEPHLHYHLQNGPEFGRAEGLPAQFLGYTADGARVERGEPTKGQTITP